ncbi:MAG: hypothetical protein K2K02_09190 [Ruminococcus sp.]|nr:hypothetical protein [Ruminococcus sp.]MDE6679201.1 hypothetical protein [Ruminococcus sp.]
MLFIVVAEITVVCTLTFCGVIAVLTALMTVCEWISYEIKEEIHIVDMQEKEE